jgi:hypothetical protein
MSVRHLAMECKTRFKNVRQQAPEWVPVRF